MKKAIFGILLLVLATVTGAASGALSATGLGVGAQMAGNAVIGFVGELVSQFDDGTIGTNEGKFDLCVAAVAGCFTSQVITRNSEDIYGVFNSSKSRSGH